MSLCLVADAQLSDAIVLEPLVPCGILMLSIVRLVSMASLVTEKCGKVPLGWSLL